MQMTFYFDQSKCMGCNTCTVACKEWNGVNPGPVRWRRQNTYEEAGGIFSFVMSCNHCEEPACMAACGTGAITKRSDGIVTVDRDKCQELKSCVSACSFAVPKLAEDKQEPSRQDSWMIGINHPMQKCDFCSGRIDKGEKTACIESCPAYALDCGTEEYIKAMYPEAVKLNKTDFPYAYSAENPYKDTGPSIYIKKARGFKITKAV